MGYTTPLNEACKKNNREIIRFLVELGANPIIYDLDEERYERYTIDSVSTCIYKIRDISYEIKQRFDTKTTKEYFNHLFFGDPYSESLPVFSEDDSEYINELLEEFNDYKEILKLFSTHESTINFYIDWTRYTDEYNSRIAFELGLITKDMAYEYLKDNMLSYCYDHDSAILFEKILPKIEGDGNVENLKKALDKLSDGYKLDLLIISDYLCYISVHEREILLDVLISLSRFGIHKYIDDFLDSENECLTESECLSLLKTCYLDEFQDSCSGFLECDICREQHYVHCKEEDIEKNYYNIVSYLIDNIAIEDARDILNHQTKLYRHKNAHLFRKLVERILGEDDCVDSCHVLALARNDEFDIFRKVCFYKIYLGRFPDEFIEESGPKVKAFLKVYMELYQGI